MTTDKEVTSKIVQASFMVQHSQKILPPHRPFRAAVPASRSLKHKRLIGRLTAQASKKMDISQTRTSAHHSAELSENDQVLRLCIDLPGVLPKDVSVSVENHVLTIRASRQSYSIDGRTCLRQQHIHKRFGLDLSIVDVTRLRSSLAHGVVTIWAPKKSSPHFVPVTVEDDDVSESHIPVLVGPDLSQVEDER